MEVDSPNRSSSNKIDNLEELVGVVNSLVIRVHIHRLEKTKDMRNHVLRVGKRNLSNGVRIRRLHVQFVDSIDDDEADIDIRGCHTNEVWAIIVGSIFHLHSSGIVPLNSIHFKSKPVNVGRTKAEFDALISNIANLKPEELVDSDTFIWSLSHDDKFLVNSVRKHIDELYLPSLSPSTWFYFPFLFLIWRVGSLASVMARLKGKEGPRLRHLC
ncbi:hypothetical protein Tco_0659327 [Tanacetum coccineum]